MTVAHMLGCYVGLIAALIGQQIAQSQSASLNHSQYLTPSTNPQWSSALRSSSFVYGGSSALTLLSSSLGSVRSSWQDSWISTLLATQSSIVSTGLSSTLSAIDTSSSAILTSATAGTTSAAVTIGLSSTISAIDTSSSAILTSATAATTSAAVTIGLSSTVSTVDASSSAIFTSATAATTSATFTIGLSSTVSTVDTSSSAILTSAATYWLSSDLSSYRSDASSQVASQVSTTLALDSSYRSMSPVLSISSYSPNYTPSKELTVAITSTESSASLTRSASFGISTGNLAPTVESSVPTLSSSMAVEYSSITHLTKQYSLTAFTSSAKMQSSGTIKSMMQHSSAVVRQESPYRSSSRSEIRSISSESMFSMLPSLSSPVEMTAKTTMSPSANINTATSVSNQPFSVHSTMRLPESSALNNALNSTLTKVTASSTSDYTPMQTHSVSSSFKNPSSSQQALQTITPSFTVSVGSVQTGYNSTLLTAATALLSTTQLSVSLSISSGTVRLSRSLNTTNHSATSSQSKTIRSFILTSSIEHHASSSMLSLLKSSVTGVFTSSSFIQASSVIPTVPTNGGGSKKISDTIIFAAGGGGGGALLLFIFIVCIVRARRKRRKNGKAVKKLEEDVPKEGGSKSALKEHWETLRKNEHQRKSVIKMEIYSAHNEAFELETKDMQVSSIMNITSSSVSEEDVDENENDELRVRCGTFSGTVKLRKDETHSLLDVMKEKRKSQDIESQMVEKGTGNTELPNGSATKLMSFKGNSGPKPKNSSFSSDCNDESGDEGLPDLSKLPPPITEEDEAEVSPEADASKASKQADESKTEISSHAQVLEADDENKRLSEYYC